MLARLGRGHRGGAVPALRIIVIVIIRVVVLAVLIFLLEFVILSFNTIVIVNIQLVFHTHEGEGIRPGCAIVEVIHDLFGFSVTDSVDA